MIYIIFIFSLAIYLIFLFFKNIKSRNIRENFALNEKNIYTYFLIGNFPIGFDKHLNLFERLDSEFEIKKCKYENYEIDDEIDDEMNDENNYNNNVFNLNVSKAEVYDICGVQIKNKLMELKDENKINYNNVFIFSYGISDIRDINFEYENKLSEEEKKQKYKKAINKIIDLDTWEIFKNTNNNDKKNYFLFLNLNENDDTYKTNEFMLWNLQLKEFIKLKNKLPLNKKKDSKERYKIINFSDDLVDSKGFKASDGIPRDLYNFICEKEFCSIKKKHNCKRIHNESSHPLPHS